MFLLSLGIFLHGFYSVYPSDQYPLNPSVWLHLRTAQLLYWGGPYIIFIPKPEYWPRHLGCDWCRPAVAF